MMTTRSKGRPRGRTGWRRPRKAQAAMSEAEYDALCEASELAGVPNADYIRLAVAERAAADLRRAKREGRG